MANTDLWVYVLDTSVASLILDGELWSREPGLVVRYHTDLQATLLRPDLKMVLSDLEQTHTVKRSMSAWKWAQDMIKNQETTGVRLVVTPTVQSELTSAMQVCCKLYIHTYDV